MGALNVLWLFPICSYLNRKIGKHNFADKIIGGDFNLVLNEQLDAANRKSNNHKSQGVIKNIMEEYMFVDPWREQNPNSFEFTWHRRKPNEVYARLDYILINYALMNDVKNVKNAPSF